MKSESNSKYTLNTELIKEYFTQIEEITNIINLNNKDMISSILKMPEVLVKGEEKVDDNEWLKIQKGVDTAIANILQFRLEEGKKLEADISARINTLARLLVEVAPFAKNRI